MLAMANRRMRRQRFNSGVDTDFASLFCCWEEALAAAAAVVLVERNGKDREDG